MKIFLTIIFCLILSGFVFAQSSEVEKTYDKFKDKTSLKINIGMFLAKSGSGEHGMMMLVVTSYPGQKMPSNLSYSILLISASKKWKFLKSDLTLRAIIDEKRISMGIMKRADSDITGTGVTEILTLPTTLKEIEMLGNSKNIEMQLGGSEFSLGAEQIQHFTVFADAIKKETTVPINKVNPKKSAKKT